MARHAEFDRDKVLDAAMQVFWTKGYQATSVVDLERATGLKPGSLYNAFDSKKGLFLAVIAHYRETVVGLRVATILDSGRPMEGIEAFFRTAYDGFEAEQLIGCLLTNTATEMAPDDPEIQEAVASGITMIENAFRRRIREAQAAGEIDAGVDAAATAVHLTSCFQGLGVIGRLTRDPERLKAITEQALTAFKPA